MAYSDSHIESGAERLFVLSGELRGVSVPLDERIFRVGSSAECDVVLLGNDGVEAEVSFISASDNTFSVSDPLGQVRVGRKTLFPGKKLAVKSGIPISVGDTKLMVAQSIDAADKAENSSKRRFTQITWAASIAVIVASFGIFEWVSERGTVVAKTMAPTELTSNYVDTLDFELVAKATQQQLNSNDLSHISASTDNDIGTVKVRGRLRDSEQARWREVSTWFDATYGGTIMLDVKLDAIEDAVTLPFSISAVWMGQSPHLTLHDGSQRYTGDLLPGGWKLEKIASKKIMISKGSESLMIPL